MKYLVKPSYVHPSQKQVFVYLLEAKFIKACKKQTNVFCAAKDRKEHLFVHPTSNLLQLRTKYVQILIIIFVPYAVYIQKYGFFRFNS